MGSGGARHHQAAGRRWGGRAWSTAGRAGEGFLHQRGSTITSIGNNSKNTLFFYYYCYYFERNKS